MKIQFNPDLDFQQEAIDSIVDIFKGQEVCSTNFTVASLVDEQDSLQGVGVSDLGIGNKLKLLEEDILGNVNDIQLRNGLRPTEELNSMDFTVEMETGTGKTYVYLRTIFELNRQYGFTKFIIVVPSIAIKEGVHKSLKMTKEHFKGLYENIQSDFFVYDSKKLNQVRNFATSDCIQIMVINIDAFRKSFTDLEKESKANIIHRPHDRMSGARPIDFIRSTNPILIIDEPQSVDNTTKSKEAIASLGPLCSLRYSATHVEKYNMMYKLDSVDAYDRKLVKQIEVASIEVQGGYNKPYIKLLSVDNKKSPITARIEIDVRQNAGGVKRIKKKVRTGHDLLDLSGGRDVYDGYIIEDIFCEKGNEYIGFTSKTDIIRLGQAVGEVNDDEYKRLQIRKTIEEHLAKELRLHSKGIKVLSLFFIDRVANYRGYDDEGNPKPGKYAVIFEEEYERAIKKPKYNTLFKDDDLETAVEGIHDGYFAIDNKKDTRGKSRLKDSSGEGKTKSDESAYQLIMRDKEKLLSFDSKLKFIFSHSALKEGWDNPNVFQICTLNETSSLMKKRQEIGRGLRIAVNQQGERVHGFEVNTLTVMANESYEDFATQLQKEIEEEGGIKFGVVEKHLFANIPVLFDGHTIEYLGVEKSEQVWDYLKEKSYIDARGKIQDSLRADIKAGKVELPKDMIVHSEKIINVLRKTAGSLNIKNADDRRRVELNKGIFLSEEFKTLWECIKYKTTFRVSFDSETLIQKCVDEINKNLIVGRAKFITRLHRQRIDRGGVHGDQVDEQHSIAKAEDYQLPDLLSYLQNETNLTRRTLVEILQRSDRLQDFKNNPQKYIEQVASIIHHQKRLLIVDGIKYQKIGDEHFYGQELFEENELYGYLSKNMLEADKSAYDHVIYDSHVEEEFARKFEINEDVKVYAKLPAWFKIETPLGTYNPDWAVLIEIEGKQKLYFVVETKHSLFSDALRPAEQAKIDCGREHFKALGNDVEFTVANSYDSFVETLSTVS